MERLQYVVLAPIVGAAGPVAASGAWAVRAFHAIDAVAAARARCLRPGDYDWKLAVACVVSTVLDAISKGT